MQFMRKEGNLAAKAFYEKCVPAFFYRPQESDCVWDFFPSVNKIAAWSQEKWIKPLVDQWVEEAKEEEGCWGPTERCTCEFCPSICEFTFLFLSAFWRISGSGQSTKGENLLGKTYHKHTPQVIDNIVLFQAAEFCMYICARDVLNCVSLTPDQFESTLWKKGKDNKNFLRRVFLLSRNDFTLRYLVKGDVSCPFAAVSYKGFFWCALYGTKVSFSTSLTNPSLRLPKLSSPWRTWMRFSNQRRSAILMGCRSHTCRGSEWGICLFITKTDRWAHLPLQGNRATRSEECLSCNAICFFVCLFSTCSHFFFYVQVLNPVAFLHRRHSQKFYAACLTYRWSCPCSMLSEQHGWHTCKRNTRPCETSM